MNGLLEDDVEDMTADMSQERRASRAFSSRRRRTEKTLFGRFFECFSAALAPFAPCFTPRVATCALFLFAYRLPPTSLVTFTTFAYAQFTLPAWGYSVMLLLSMLGGILTH